MRRRRSPKRKILPDPKYKNTLCGGVYVHVQDRKHFSSVTIGMSMIGILNRLYPNEFKFNESSFDRLAGVSQLRLSYQKNRTNALSGGYDAGLNEFIKIREKYLMY